MTRFLSLLFVMTVFVQYATADGRIDAIEVEGNRVIDSSMVLLQVSSKPEAEFDATVVDRDVKEIYRMGFFSDVAAAIKETKGRRVLVFEVKEKPAIRSVRLKGNEEVEDDEFKEKLNIEARRFFDEQKILSGIAEVKALYQKQGYYGTVIDYAVEPAEGNQVDLAFYVTEGEERLIREVVFEGNREIDDDELEGVVETTHYKWWVSWISGSGVVKEDELETDVQRLTQFYLNKGYVDVRITEPAIETIEDGLVIRFKVNEGDMFTIGRISVSGDLLDEGSEETLEGVGLVHGDVFSIDVLREDTFHISGKFTDIGYAFVNVDRRTNIDRALKSVDVEFVVDKGDLISIDRINIVGNEKTADNVVRRSLKIQEHDLFSSSKIDRSQELLKRLGYFEEVSITTEPTDDERTVDLAVSVREGSTGMLSAGAGISSGDGFLASLRVSENNLFGTGNSLTFDVNTGTSSENYILSFRNPRVRDSYWSFGSDLLAVERVFDDFDRKQVGGSISCGYPMWFWDKKYFDDVRLNLRYELVKVRIDDVEEEASLLVKNEEGTSTSSSITPRIVRNTIDNPIDPTRGSKQDISIEIAGIGGDEKFWLISLKNSIYYPLVEIGSRQLIFAQRSRFGWGDTFDDEDFPLFRRFFPGGINSVRGFDSRELGPKNEEGNEFGGNKQLVGNFELIFPLVSEVGLKGLVFYDVGNAFDDNDGLNIGDMRQAWGWGIRWRSPLAPIRIEFGYPIDREDGEDSVVTHFSFGAPL